MLQQSSGMDAIAARVVNQKAAAQSSNRIDKCEFGGSKPVFQIKSVQNKADHIAAKVIDSEMKESANNQAQVFSILQSALIHTICVNGTGLSHLEFIDHSQYVQGKDDECDDWDLSSHQ